MKVFHAVNLAFLKFSLFLTLCYDKTLFSSIVRYQKKFTLQSNCRITRIVVTNMSSRLLVTQWAFLAQKTDLFSIYYVEKIQPGMQKTSNCWPRLSTFHYILIIKNYLCTKAKLLHKVRENALGKSVLLNWCCVKSLDIIRKWLWWHVNASNFEMRNCPFSPRPH